MGRGVSGVFVFLVSGKVGIWSVLRKGERRERGVFWDIEELERFWRETREQEQKEKKCE